MNVSVKFEPIQKAHILSAADDLDQNKHDSPSSYFVVIPEKNGEYPFKELVRRALFFATGQKPPHDFFNNSDYYRNNFSEIFGYQTIFKVRNNIPFFTEEGLKHFARIAGTSYEKENEIHRMHGDWLKRNILAQTEAWAKALNIEGFEVEPDRNWQRYQKMLAYTWARIYRKGDQGKKLYFTVGVDADEMALVYKLHGQFNSANPENAFTEHQEAVYNRMVKNTPAGWVQIDADQLEKYTWEILISETTRFIEQYTYLYDEVLHAFQQPPYHIIANNFQVSEPRFNSLNLTPIPLGIGVLPEWNKPESGRDIDYEMDYKHKKNTGDGGESLVMILEQTALQESGRPDLAKKVRKAKDWEGFDIQSFYADGRDKLIEVKTTEGPESRPFYWTKNEKHTMINNSHAYCLYRLYNYDSESNAADYFILEGNILDKILLSEETYKVYIK